MRLSLKIGFWCRLGQSVLTPQEKQDVRQVKVILICLGYYLPDPRVGMTDDIDTALVDAVRMFQRVNMITYREWIDPGGLMERKLNEEMENLSSEAAYIWRTVGDEKVRGHHAARSGMRFQWNNPPEGGHPGEDYNCRCWAEPLILPRHPLIEESRSRQREIYEQSASLHMVSNTKDNSPYEVENAYPDAINPTWSPLDFIGGGAYVMRGAIREGVKSAINIVRHKFVESPYTLTGHGRVRAQQRNISEKEITSAIRTAKKSGNVTTKEGKYGTKQLHYKGTNGVSVIVEVEGRNAGKIITIYRNLD